MLAPKFGHRSVMYEMIKGVTSVLHIGGDPGDGFPDQVPIERWDMDGPGMHRQNSTLILNSYTSFPEIFAVSSSFCNTTMI